MASKTILLVEDNPDDEALTLRALTKNNIANELIVARDGEEALDVLFCTGQYSGKDPNRRPHVVLLDLNLPKVAGGAFGRDRDGRLDGVVFERPMFELFERNLRRDLARMGGANGTGWSRGPASSWPRSA